MREQAFRSPWSLTLILIVVNAAVYALGLVAALAAPAAARRALTYLALSPEGLAQGWVWQLLTFQFLHGGPLHLLLNCAMLYVFGRPLEAMLGRPLLLRLYVTSGIAGGLLQVACAWMFPAHFGLGGVVGASAGVFGLIAAFAALNREAPITTLVAFIIPVTMRAKYLLLVELIVAVLFMLGPPDGVAHAAHLGGMLGALAYLQIRHLAVRSRLRWPRLRPAAAPRELVAAAAPHAPGRRQRQVEAAPQISAAEFMAREVDPILDKISAHGIHSLTEREKRILELARARMNRP